MEGIFQVLTSAYMKCGRQIIHLPSEYHFHYWQITHQTGWTSIPSTECVCQNSGEESTYMLELYEPNMGSVWQRQEGEKLKLETYVVASAEGRLYPPKLVKTSNSDLIRDECKSSKGAGTKPGQENDTSPQTNPTLNIPLKVSKVQ